MVFLLNVANKFMKDAYFENESLMVKSNKYKSLQKILHMKGSYNISFFAQRI